MTCTVNLHDVTRFDVSVAVNVTDVLPRMNGVPIKIALSFTDLI